MIHFHGFTEKKRENIFISKTFIFLPYFCAFVLVPVDYDTKRYYCLFPPHDSKQASKQSNKKSDHKNRISDKDKNVLTICVLISVCVYIVYRIRNIYSKIHLELDFFLYMFSFDATADDDDGDAEGMR